MHGEYAYIYDEATGDKPYARLLADFEAELHTLGLDGRVAKLHALQKPEEVISDQIRLGSSHIILVGRPEFLQRFFPLLASMKVIGSVVPICEGSSVAACLGMPVGKEAVPFLARRKLIKWDMGLMNGQPFFHGVEAPAAHIRLTINHSYRLEAGVEWRLAIGNATCKSVHGYESDPRDGFLDLYCFPPARAWWKRWLPEEEYTHLCAEHILIEPLSGDVELALDGRPLLLKKAEIRVMPGSMTLICGKIEGESL